MAIRIRKVKVATVLLWGQEVGAVMWDDLRGVARFEYDPAFVAQGSNIAPLTMPLRGGIHEFPELRRTSFQGLPGLLADSLPDRFGNRLIDLWLERQGRSKEDFSPVERLCYLGTRGMGALEFKPATGPRASRAVPIEVTELTQLAEDILRHRADWAVNLKGAKADALNTIIRVGTSAGGNRAKAVIVWNPQTGEVRSGQADTPAGFEPWILKFDGVNEVALGDPKGFGRVEYAYHRMAVAAGIEMNACRLLEESGRAHFMTRRFDRDAQGGKIHMQSLCALGHYDFNAAGEYGYEQAFAVIQKLNLGHEALREMFRRMLFNVLARNQDDHTRNIAFLMDRAGQWRLAPAFDVIWAYNPAGGWTSRHQMSLNGKRDNFTRADLLAVAEQFGLKRATELIATVGMAVANWIKFAQDAKVDGALSKTIALSHRLNLMG
ncbi:MAG: type II toxin-antitoxin system HipA family toxin [Verrucomicrobia bacterium]|nr:type II toxin-antitoxin system HipA family toxin [Verrucomicrobiota bacterium]MBU1735929.1 type II toxin-antitoxin system HipA family toxin [Verrucomicrobiota bacterium]MBU1857165.1 type II toxin-antitoxin system HipA family toxin [Verrucomicrobiota bacterium]